MSMKILAAMLLSVIMLSSGFMINSPATAAPNENANDNAKRSFKLPEGAVEIAPGIFHIGTAIHEGKVVDGLAIFHHRDGHDGGPGGGGPGGGPGGNGGGEDCFAFIGKGAKWKVVEDYLVDPDNTVGLNEQAVRTNIAAAVAAWNAHTSDILGDEVSGTVDGVDTVSPDGQNEVLFGDILDENVIAVNILWGIFRGPPSDRELVEWDQMYDQDHFGWEIMNPNNPNLSKMDFLNIAAHEVGHATGMAHPDNSCTEETMYAFAALGETKKRILNSGDIAGIQELYG